MFQQNVSSIVDIPELIITGKEINFSCKELGNGYQIVAVLSMSHW